jgi:hypothetical protein
MRRVDPPKTVVIEFTVDEARRLEKSLGDDFSWDRTTESELYEALYDLLSENIE